MASLMRYETPDAMTITMRIMKIQTSNVVWIRSYAAPAEVGLTASRMNVISATPVTP